MEDNINTIKKLLLVIVIPLIVYLLKLLSFIFIPLVFAVFLAVMFTPMMRWLYRKNVPQAASIIIVILVILGALKGSVEIVQLSSQDIFSEESEVWDKADDRLKKVTTSINEFFGWEIKEEGSSFKSLIQNKEVTDTMYKNFGSTFNFVRTTVTMILMTLFFLVLLLAGSLNIKQIMEKTLFRKRRSSTRYMMRIEDNIITFIKVKFLVSLGTGLATGAVCYFFGISFPLFWGVLAFAINFIQMIGSVISVILVSAFAFIEMDVSGTLLFFVLLVTAVQVLFGGILEPILMGKSFSINTVTVLVMLMLWGFLWGIPGLILSVPITVFIKSVLEQFPKTKIIAEFMS